MPQKLFVRFSTTADAQAIFDFYAQNQHQYVFQRDPAVWNERISAGAVTMIHDDAGKIVAAAIAYPLTNDRNEHEWSELGSVRVQLDGIGLAKPLISAMVMRAYLLEPPKDRFIIEIAANNSHSKHVFNKLGATAYDIPAELEKKVNSTITTANKPAIDWFQMGAEVMPSIAQNLLDGAKNGLLTNKTTGEEYELDFSRCTLMTQFTREMQDLAGQDFGNPQKPDLKKGLGGGLNP